MNLREWAEQAKPGDKTTYGPSQKSVARELFDEGRAILYQERGARGFVHVIQRCSDRAAAWLDRMSKATPAPYNRWAHGYEGD